MGRGWIWAAVFGALFAMVVHSGYLYLDFRERQERQAWEEMNRSVDDLIERFPPRETNEAAHHLVELGARIGLALAPDGVPQPPIGEPLHGRMIEWTPLLVELEGASGATRPVVELPPEVLSFLETHRDDLREIEALALGKDVIWAEDIQRLAHAPFPRLLEGRFLHNLLLLRALSLAREGRSEGAQRTLEAAWRLNQSLRRRPELISQVLAMALDRMLFECLRRVGSSEEEWRPRLGSQRYRESVLASFQVETWIFTRPEMRTETAWDGPYARLAAANSSEVARLWVGIFSPHETDCRFDIVRAGKTMQQSIPKWNVIARRAFPNLLRPWRDAMRTDLEAELTLLVLETARRPDRFGQTRESVDSRVCRGFTWHYRSSPEGLAITLSEAPFFVKKPGSPPSYILPSDDSPP